MTAAELYKIMRNIKTWLKVDCILTFFGAKIIRNMKFLRHSEQDQLIKESSEVYKRTLKPYDFEHFVFKIFSKFDLISAVIYKDAVEAYKLLGLKSVDEDKLYGETRKLKQV